MSTHEFAPSASDDPLGDAFWNEATMPVEQFSIKGIRLIDNGDGGQLAYGLDGNSSGAHVISMGGNPSGLDGATLRYMHLYQRGIGCAHYDRPGYGASTRQPGRTIGDSAEHIKRIADDLGWEEFSIVARSGAVPHAMATASILGERVKRIALLAGVAEATTTEIEDWTAGMTESNVRRHTAARQDPLALATDYREVAKRTHENPESFLDTLRESYTEVDESIIGLLGLGKLLGQGYAWALRQGGAGWFDDTLALQRPWGIQPKNITAEVFLWHGQRDPFADVNHAQWNASRMSQASVYVSSLASHFNAMQVAVPATSWAAYGDTKRLLQQAKEVDDSIFAMQHGMDHFHWDLLKGLWQAYKSTETPLRYTKSSRLPLG
jgi:pimeloyl-ACP methyl ester carboxylesterase